MYILLDTTTNTAVSGEISSDRIDGPVYVLGWKEDIEFVRLEVTWSSIPECSRLAYLICSQGLPL